MVREPSPINFKTLLTSILSDGRQARVMEKDAFRQLGALQYGIPPNLRQSLNELPETLDETYDETLNGINKARKKNVHCPLQCLAVAVRPLLVKEFAELLAFDFQASTEGGIPTLKEDWHRDDQEEAILSTCSGLIAIIPSHGYRVVQFSHSSVREYLTSSRLAQSPHGSVSQFHIDLEPAHTTMAQACLATMLLLDESTSNSDAKMSLVQYAAEHWVEHAQIENVSSRVQGGMDDLFDSSKPHFAAWLRVHDMDEHWTALSPSTRSSVGSPLYYAAFCGFYDLIERLIMKHPEQVNERGGYCLFPLPAALSKSHFHVADLLYRHGAVVDVQGDYKTTPLFAASFRGQVDIMRWLLNHDADANAQSNYSFTPLFEAVSRMHLEALQVLFHYNADINSQNFEGKTPLYYVLSNYSSKCGFVDMVRQLLELGADPNICANDYATPLHEASSRGLLEVTRLLLSHGAKVNEEDKEGKTPFQVAASDEMTSLLLEHGTVPQT